MFVPSLSWQSDRLYICKWLKKSGASFLQGVVCSVRGVAFRQDTFVESALAAG